MAEDGGFSEKLGDWAEQLKLLVVEVTSAFTGPDAEQAGAHERVAAIDVAVAALWQAVEELQVASEELVHQNDELAHSRAEFADLFESAPDAYVVTDGRGLIQSVNARAEAMLNQSRAWLAGKPLLGFISSTDHPGFLSFLRGLPDEGVGSIDVELSPWHHDPVPASVRAVSQHHVSGVQTIRWLLHDDTQRVLLERRLTHRATSDDLTGIANRGHLLSTLETIVAGSAVAEERVAVVYVDLDGFKQVNDRLGHESGDELLRDAARRIVRAVRPRDVVGRLGGDEFAIVLRDADEALGRRLAERVLAALAAPFALTRGEVEVTASIGVATRLPRGVAGAAAAEQVLSDADAAMYRAKHTGRNRCVVFGEALDAELSTRRAHEARLQMAEAGGELAMHYQPVMDLRDGTIMAVEGLLRWDAPGVGLQSAVDFIDIIEDNGLIVSIGAWAINEACAQAAAWAAEFPGACIPVAANISPKQLSQVDIVPIVASALAGAALEPSLLCLEITERSEPVGSSLRTLHELRDLGVHLAIGDFGAGPSSVSYLRDLPVDSVKLDRSFVSGLSASPRDTQLLGAITQLTDALGVAAVAAGVERCEQLEVLAAAHCHYAQGNLLAPAATADVVSQRIRATR